MRATSPAKTAVIASLHSASCGADTAARFDEGSSLCKLRLNEYPEVVMASRLTDIAVFGGGGFIGRHLLRALLRLAPETLPEALRIRVICRNAVKVRVQLAVDSDQRLQQAVRSSQITFVTADVTQEEQVLQALRPLPQSVANLVGLLYETPPERTFEKVHVKAAENISKAFKLNEQAEHTASSELERPIMTQVSAIGADFTAVHSAYARSKGLAEQALLSHLGKQVLIIRPSIVFGPGDQFFTRFRDMARFSPALPLIGTGDTRFQPVYVEDLALALARSILPAERKKYVAMESSAESSMDSEHEQIFELGGRDILTFRELMARMLSVTQMRRLLVPIPLSVANIQAQASELLHRMVPSIPPMLTRDQIALLQRDNVVHTGYRTFRDLGIDQPRGVDAETLAYLAERR